MTTSQPDRLDRLEALLEQTAQIAQSNGRAIQSMLDAQVEDRLERQELREATVRIANLTEGLANWMTRLDENQPTILRKLNSIERKVDELLEGDSDSAK